MPKTSRKRTKRDTQHDVTVYLHHLEQAAVHIAAARQHLPLAGSTPGDLGNEELLLRRIGKACKVLHMRAGGHPDA